MDDSRVREIPPLLPGREPDPGFLEQCFPQLDVIEMLGRGGMGIVYKARQAHLDRFVALKLLLPSNKDDRGFSERFNREARALARLNHPNILSVYEFGHARGYPYLLMEYVDGPNLRQIEHTHGLGAEEALRIVPQICDALQFAHDEGIVHRDIKPENVLLDKRGRVKIADFGLAKLRGHERDRGRLTGDRDLMGTPNYMAPEQVERPTEVDHRADIYSLGVVFYEMLTGELPLGRFDPPSAILPHTNVDTRLDAVVMRTLAKEPSRRYQQASEVKTELELISQHKGQPTGSPTVASRTEKSYKLPLLVAAVLVLIVLVGLAIMGPVTSRSPDAPSNRESAGSDPGSSGREEIAPRSDASLAIPARVAPEPAQALEYASVPPVVIRTFPEAGATDVDPALNRLSVTFSKPMEPGSYSWCIVNPEQFPEIVAEPIYTGDNRTCELGVKLQRGRVYAVWLNSGEANNFRDRQGLSAVPYLLVFKTAEQPTPK